VAINRQHEPDPAAQPAIGPLSGLTTTSFAAVSAIVSQAQVDGKPARTAEVGSESAEKPKDMESLEKISGLFTAGFAALTAVIGTASGGANGSLIERIVRNHASLSAAAFLCVDVAIVLAILSLLLSGRNIHRPDVNKWLIGLLHGSVIAYLSTLLFSALSGPGGALSQWPDAAQAWEPWGRSLAVVLFIALLFVIGLSRLPNGGVKLNFGRVLLGSASLLLAVGLVLITIPAIMVQASQERPSVSATLKSDPSLAVAATVKASGVPANQTVSVVIDEVKIGDSTRGEHPHTVARLYSAQLGPDPSGEVDLSIEVPVPPGDYELIGIKATVIPSMQSGTTAGQDPSSGAAPLAGCVPGQVGCTLLRVPKAPKQPLLAASWDTTATDRPVLVIALSAKGLWPADEIVRLRVIGTPGAGGTGESELYTAVYSADAKGSIDKTTINIPVDGSVAACVVARVESRIIQNEGLACPGKDESIEAWTRSQVPQKLSGGAQ